MHSILTYILDNFRYTLNWCLWGATIDASVALCDEACQPIKESLNVTLENSNSPTPYGYCEDLDREGFANCAACYAKVSDRKYLSNCKVNTTCFVIQLDILIYYPRSVLNLLSSACEWQILPPKKFPIKGSQVFTQNPPSNYSSPSDSSGLSTEAKLAIGISIPIIIFLFLCALLLLWYFKFRLPRKPPSQVSEPEFQLWERQGEKWNQAPDLTPSSTWKSDPLIYHSTPPPQQSRHHPPFRLQLPPPRRQGTTRPKMQLETETIADQYAGTYSPSELFGESPISPRTALRQEHGQKGKGRSQVSFNIRGRPARPEKGVGMKEAVVSEDLF